MGRVYHTYSGSENIRPLILNWPFDGGSFQLTSGAERPHRIGKQRTPQDHKVRLIVGYDRLGQIRAVNQADCAGHHSRLRFDCGCEWRLVAGMNGDPLPGIIASGRAVDQIDIPALFEKPAESDTIFECPPALDPIGRGNADEYR